MKPVGKASNGDKTESCVSLMLLLNSALRKQAKERFLTQRRGRALSERERREGEDTKHTLQTELNDTKKWEVTERGRKRGRKCVISKLHLWIRMVE